MELLMQHHILRRRHTIPTGYKQTSNINTNTNQALLPNTTIIIIGNTPARHHHRDPSRQATSPLHLHHFLP